MATVTYSKTQESDISPGGQIGLDENVLPEPITAYGLFEIVVLFFIYIIFIITLPFAFCSLTYQIFRFEKGIYFRFGKFIAIKESGLGVRLPWIDSIRKVDMRVGVIDLPQQESITKDSVSVRVNGVVYYRVISAEKATINVVDHFYATTNIAQTTMRQVIGEYELEDIISRRDEINKTLKKIIDERTIHWGISIESVELKDVTLPQSMVRALASQAEAERDKRAKIIAADGEKLSSEKLRQAADILSSNPASLQIRTLQTIQTIAIEHNNTIVLPIPIDLVNGFLRRRN